MESASDRFATSSSRIALAVLLILTPPPVGTCRFSWPLMAVAVFQPIKSSLNFAILGLLRLFLYPHSLTDVPRSFFLCSGTLKFVIFFRDVKLLRYCPGTSRIASKSVVSNLFWLLSKTSATASISFRPIFMFSTLVFAVPRQACVAS